MLALRRAPAPQLIRGVLPTVERRGFRRHAMSQQIEGASRTGAPGHQTAFERWLERVFILFAKAMTAMAS